MPVRGFILQPSYRIESGRPAVCLWGRLETGESFLVRDDRSVPHFYIRSSDRIRAEKMDLARWRDDPRTTLAGEPVVRVEVGVPADTPPIRERLHRAEVPTYEADVRFAMRFLIDRDIRGSMSIEGIPQLATRGVDQLFENPELQQVDWTPELKVLSLDIETDPLAHNILSIGLYGCGAAEVILVSPEGEAVPSPAVPVASERALLQALQKRVRELDPDILTGWNVVDFDFAVLLRRAEDLGVSLQLGRGHGATRFRAARGRWQGSQIMIPGRLVLDGLQLLRGAFVRMERHSLDFVAREVLGEGKTLSCGSHGEQILWLYQSDLPRFVQYNLTDARLVLEILDKLQLVELAVERSKLTGMPLDRVSSSVAAFDFLYLKELSKRGVVAPSVRGEEDPGTPMGGGHVFEPVPGLHDNVLVLDFKSLYPSLIRTFQIDPLGYVGRPDSNQDVITAPNGASFLRQRGILTLLLDDLVPRREQAKRKGKDVESFAIKILMNSFYGVLGTPVCRFYNPAVANAITSSGRQLLLWSKRQLEQWGYRVLYGDTDSLFVESGERDPQCANSLGLNLVVRLNKGLEEHILATWRVESRLEVELEKLYVRLFLPAVRRGTAGARKRYAGLVERGGELQVDFTGLEAVRRDWTDLARQAQRELYRRLFLDLPIEKYLRDLVASVRRGELDSLLVYRKGLRKELDAYTVTTPPHVAAARKLTTDPGRLISYLMTVDGPEPIEQVENPIDYEHYLEKQLQPIAEPILDQLDLNFAKVVGDDRQLDLF